MRDSRENGEIIEEEGGGRIVRSLRRKDRHSKVCTSKGQRDRRVRLAANTAIQFYDVQDRLSYDRPSKAIDWLIKEAKPAIDALEDDHCDRDLLIAVRDSSEAFRRTDSERNEQISTDAQTVSRFEDYPLGLIDSRKNCEKKPSEEDFTWNPSYDSGDGFNFVDREPLQSSYYPTIIRSFNNEFVDDEAFLAFNFQHDNQLEEEGNSNLVSKTPRYS